jgi:hypothetical protein
VGVTLQGYMQMQQQQAEIKRAAFLQTHPNGLPNASDKGALVIADSSVPTSSL